MLLGKCDNQREHRSHFLNEDSSLSAALEALDIEWKYSIFKRKSSNDHVLKHPIFFRRCRRCLACCL